MIGANANMIMQPVAAARTALPKAAYQALKSLLRRCLSIVPDLDPVMRC